jgi:hypothetical protein
MKYVVLKGKTVVTPAGQVYDAGYVFDVATSGFAKEAIDDMVARHKIAPAESEKVVRKPSLGEMTTAKKPRGRPKKNADNVKK